MKKIFKFYIIIIQDRSIRYLLLPFHFIIHSGFVFNYDTNRMTISDYNTKPVRGDRAIIFL